MPSKARRTLIDADFDILVARCIAELSVSIDLVYLITDGQCVLGGDDPAGIQRALGQRRRP